MRESPLPREVPVAHHMVNYQEHPFCCSHVSKLEILPLGSVLADMNTSHHASTPGYGEGNPKKPRKTGGNHSAITFLTSAQRIGSAIAKTSCQISSHARASAGDTCASQLEHYQQQTRPGRQLSFLCDMRVSSLSTIPKPSRKL
jgi:hypothetical protein